jgi:RNA polymerase sigma-70 factor, ECF subfamily
MINTTVPSPAPPRPGSRCGRDACAGLCLDQGLQAAHRRHHAVLHRRASRILRDDALAEDAVQEAFLRAWQGCVGFDPAGGPLVAWLLAITANVALDMRRHRSRRPPLMREDLSEAVGADAGVDVTGQAVLRAQCGDLLLDLDPEHRTAVLEAVVLDRPYEEVATVHHLPVGTVKSRVHYGLRKLRRSRALVDPSSLEAAS